MSNNLKCVECLTHKDKKEFRKVNLHKSGNTGTCKECIERMMPENRECIHCHNVKPMNQFGELKKNKFGKNTLCIDCAKDKMDKYYAEKGDKAKETKKAYREANKTLKAKQDKEYRENNKEAIYETKKKYRELKREEIAHKKKMYYASDAGRAVKRRHEHKRVMRIRETDDGSITSETLDELYTEQDGRCYLCDCDLTQLKRSRVHLDHIIPLSKGGTHVIENVAWSCMECNLQKGGKYTE